MPTLLEILQDPNYINANPATKKAIFDKYAPQDSNYVDANDATKAAIRQRFGLGTAAPAAKKEYGVPLEVPPKDKEVFVPALKASYESLMGSLALAAGKAGLTDLKEAEQAYEKRKAEEKRLYTPTEKGWTEDFGTKFKETLAGSLPYMVAPIAAAGATALAVPATVAAAPVLGGLTTAGGLAALGSYGLASGTQFTGSFIARQLEENRKKDPTAGLESTNLGTAVAAAVPATALDIIGAKAIPLVRGLFKSVGKEVTEQQAKKIADQGFRRTLADYSLATGKAAGIEGATETGQQFLERLQAGLNIADADARREYVDSFIGGAVLGGAISPAGRYIERRKEVKTPEELSQLETFQAKIEAEQAAKTTPPPPPESIAPPPPTERGPLSAPVDQGLPSPSAEPAIPEQQVAEATTKVDTLTARVAELTDEYIAAGEPPDQAKIKAAAQAAEEEQNDQAVEQSQAELAKIQTEAAKGAQDVATTIEQAGGASVPIPSEPVGGVPTGGVEPPVAPSVERPAPSVEPTVRREEVPSGAVELDPLLDQAKDIVITAQRASPSLIQRGLEVSFNRAQRILEQLEKEGVVSARGPNSVRTVLAEKPPTKETPITPVETTKPLEETPSVTTPPETQQAKEEGTTAPIEGAKVAELVAEAAPQKPKAKRGPKPKLSEEEKLDREIQGAARSEELNAIANIITSTKKLKGTDHPGLATLLDLFLGPRDTTKPSVQKMHDGFMKAVEGRFANIDDVAEKTQAANDFVAVRVRPVLEELYSIATNPRYENTRIKKLAMNQFERGPENMKKSILARVAQRQEEAKVDIEETVAPLPAAPTGPAPKVVVKKKRTIEKPEVLKQVRGARSVTDANINTAINNVRDPVIKEPTARKVAGAIVASTRNGSFENELAKRLRVVVGDTPFVIIEPNDPDTKLRKAFEKSEARGIYSANEDLLRDPAPKGIIYVAGAKYGNTKQGVNNRTVLHELLHAGSYAKIRQGQAILEADEKSTDSRAVAVRKLEDLRDAVRVKYEKEGYSKLTPGLQKILSKDGGNALYSLDEFFAYGMTDPEFQAYLKTINVGRIQKPESAFSAFVKIIRAVLGISKDFESALANLIEVSDTLLTTEPKADVADAQAKIEILSQKQDVQTAADAQVKYANDIINTPRSQGPSVSPLDQAIANGMDLSSQAELAGAIAEGAMSGARKHILGAFTPSQLAKLVVEKVPALTRVVELGRKFNAKRQQYLDEMKKTMKPWLKLQRNDREQSQLLATIMHLATVNGIDPSIPANERLASTPQSDTLDDLWEKLGEPAREIYIDVRDYYAKQYDRYKDLLEKRIQAMGISDEEKTKFMDLLKKEFEVGKVAQPYFPLMRYGENWLRVGTGKNMEFYMFESASERNRFAIRRAKEMGKPLKDLYADGTLKRGDQLTNMMEETFTDTTKLKEVLAAVDKLGIDTDKASIKDEIYQMYLLTLPEKSFRKQFIHRKGTAGFSADALRNFGTAGFRMSNQLAKMEYQPQIVNTLSEARESIKDDPDASKYRTYIEEVAADFDAAVNPKNENSILNFAANGLSTLNFFYYMSSISSALTNMTSLPVFGYPALLAEFGKTPGGAKDVHKELVRFMNVYKEVGFRRKGGDKDKIEKIKNSNLSPEEKDKRIREEERKTEYVMPSIRMALTDADEIRAYNEFAGDNLFSFNRSMDLLNIVKSPSQEATNPNILKVPVQKATDLVSGMFSMTEQLPREMMAMAAYRLGRSQGLSHDEATKKALDLTHDAMYDYSMFDTPRYFRGPVGRTIFQFKKFSQNTAFYLTTNFLQIFKGADPTIRKQAAMRFFGTLGMTGMFAGLTGMPLYTVMSTVAEKVLSAFGDDDDDEDSAIFQIRKYGYDLWFKKWLSENFGANVATYVAMGPVTGLTGADFNARVKLNDLFFPDWEFKGLLGPSFGLYENAQRAYDRFKEGQTERAIETMMPSAIRQILKAYRFNEEGVKTPKGYEVVAKEDLDWMDIAMQSIGYAPIKVSMKQSENFKLKKLEQEREEERTELLKRSVYARRGISDEDPDDIQEDIDAFNKKFPNRRITTGTIINSDQARRRQERAVDQGLYIANPMNRRELLELRAKE